MAGAVEVTARGAIEAGERGGDQPQANSAGSQGVEGGRAWYGTMRLFVQPASSEREVQLRKSRFGLHEPPLWQI
jgi:hypothetical protein